MALERVKLSDSTGVEVEVVDLGAAVDVVRAPDRRGDIGEITPRLPDDARLDPSRNPFVGVTVGPFANRLVVDGEVVLHGGPAGWCWQRWELVDASPTRAIFEFGTARATYGLQAGRLTISLEAARATYGLQAGRLTISLEATPACEMALSMTNHTYWNLGESIADHELVVDADTRVPVDETLVPTGPPVRLDAPASLPGEYDTCFLVTGHGLRRHARLASPATGRTVEVWSDHPAVQVYTGAWIDGVQAIALEPQHVPNAPALAWAPSAVVAAGETYRHDLAFHITTDGGRP